MHTSGPGITADRVKVLLFSKLGDRESHEEHSPHFAGFVFTAERALSTRERRWSSRGLAGARWGRIKGQIAVFSTCTTHATTAIQTVKLGPSGDVQVPPTFALHLAKVRT